MKLRPATKRLLALRAVRSVGQGALVVSFSLYLKDLGWKATEIGLLLSAAGLVGAGLSISVGFLSDRYGRKPFLLVYESLIVLMGIAAAFSREPFLLSTAAVIAGFGKGASGAAGPFAPAEGAWLAEEVDPKARGVVYSLNTSLGFFGMATGAVIAGLTALWAHWLPGTLRYRPLFAMTAVAALINIIMIRQIPGGGPPAQPEAKTTDEHRERTRGENRALLLLGMTNAFNGLAIGLTGPLVPYWFAIKFGIGLEKIGPIFAITFVVTGIASLITGGMTRKIGIVSSVVLSRGTGLVLLALLPIMPTYGLASLAYILRSGFNRGTVGARQALVMGLVSEGRRGVATSLNAVSNQLPSAIGPTVAGWLIQEGQLALPFYAAAGLQLVYLLLYGRIFRAYEPKR